MELQKVKKEIKQKDLILNHNNFQLKLVSLVVIGNQHIVNVEHKKFSGIKKSSMIDPKIT